MTAKTTKGGKPALLPAGFASVEITPAGSLPMGGYIARQAAAEGMHDPLCVKAVFFGSGNDAVLLLSFDLLHLSGEWCVQAKQLIAKGTGVPADNIMLAATHTHSGPGVFFPAVGRDEAVLAYEDALLGKALQAANEAIDSAEPCTLRAAAAMTEDVVWNRRDFGGIPYDLLSVLRVEDAAGKVRGHVVSFSCHPTVMSANNLQYSADLFGAAALEVERRQKGSICVMFNGAAGDLSTRFTRRRQTWPEVTRLGKKLAVQIMRASRFAEPLKISPISARAASVKLPFRKVLPVEKAERLYEEAASGFLALKGNKDIEQQLRLNQSKVEGAAAQLLISRLGGWAPLFGAEEAEVRLQVMRVGDIVFCGLPGEFFGTRAFDLANTAYSKFGFIIGYANGYWGYVLPPAEAKKGGYEAMMSPLNPEDEPKILREAKALIKEIKRLRTKT